MELGVDRAVDGVRLEAGACVAEGYRGHGGGHGIVAAEHASAMVCGGAPAGPQPSDDLEQLT
jgi:hypothetical protein